MVKSRRRIRPPVAAEADSGVAAEGLDVLASVVTSNGRLAITR
jgi:hypothetical protein